MRQHSSKSLSFLMELLMVIFFFMIAAGICVLVMSHTKEKDLYVKAVKQTLVYGQNLINQEDAALMEHKFYMDEQGRVQKDQGVYEVSIEEEETGHKGTRCRMQISQNEKELVVLYFYRREASR